METWKTPHTRYREDGSTSVANATNTTFLCSGAVQGTSTLSAHRYGSIRGCVDTVTPGFKQLVESGQIVNNPFFKVKQTFEGGGTGNSTRSDVCPLPTSTDGTDWDCSMRYYHNGFRFPEFRTNEQLICPESIVDVASAVKQAATSALAGVDSSNAEGIVTLAELGKTFAMIRSPLASMERLTQAWVNSKRMGKALRRTAVEGPRAFADQYLVYYYGMKPFLNDLQNIFDAWIAEGQEPERRTARGYCSRSETEVVVEDGEPSCAPGRSWYRNQFTRTDTIEVRSGILYRPTPNDYRKTLGLRISDIPSAVWEATPWSFLFDYFGNIGSMIKALSPKVGVEYLAAWDVVKYLIVMEARTIASGHKEPSSSHQVREGSEWARVTIEATQRTPKNPYDNVGLSLKFDPKGWSSAKQAAVSCLAIQQLHAKFGGLVQSALNEWARKGPRHTTS